MNGRRWSSAMPIPTPAVAMEPDAVGRTRRTGVLIALAALIVTAILAFGVARANASACYYTGGGCGTGWIPANSDNGYWTGTYSTYGFRDISDLSTAYAKGGWVYRVSQGVLGPWYGGGGVQAFTIIFDNYNNEQHRCGNFDATRSQLMNCSFLS
jgi:uncharacterized membrane protein